MASYTLQATATGLWDVDRPTTAISSEATAKMSPRTMLFKFDYLLTYEPITFHHGKIHSTIGSFSGIGKNLLHVGIEIIHALLYSNVLNIVHAFS